MNSYNCGSIGCIGGYVGLEIGMTPPAAKLYVLDKFREDPLFPLYFPEDVDNWSAITPDIAARVITTFLDSGEVNYRAHM
jgi:hypothetical protein